MEIILAPSDVAIIWENMQGEKKPGPDNISEELKNKAEPFKLCL